MIDFVDKYVRLVQSGLSIEKVPEKYRAEVERRLNPNAE